MQRNLSHVKESLYREDEEFLEVCGIILKHRDMRETKTE